MRVRIEIEKFSNLKFSFIFSDKEEGSIPASAPFKIKGLRAKAEQTLVRFWSAIIDLVRNSLRWRYLFPFSIADVLLGHYDGRMPQLISGLQNIAA